jgi:SSS family solute:Na+ symporter
MTWLDHCVILTYLLLIAWAGWWAGRKAEADAKAHGDTESFFLAGRSLSGWAAGTSMVATTLAADTPLVVAGLTLTKGVAGNWFWWSMAVSHVLTGVILARFWRRTGVTTDAEFCELRYGGRAAAGLRAFKAFLFAVPINCIVLGWVILAMQKVGSAVLPEVPPGQLTMGLVVMVLLYSLRSGFAGVVATDLIQFPLALGGSILLAWVAVDTAGGLGAVVAHAHATRGPQSTALFPVGTDALPWASLFAFLGVQWWAQKASDGGGILVQRLLATKSERDAEIAGLWFCFAHYVLRPWPWILTGLAAAVLVPEAVSADPEAAYAHLIVEVLPVGLRGFMVAAFLAAFMSTVDTHLNWGASYISHDLVGRFGRVPGSGRRWVNRASVVGLALLAVVTTGFMDSIEGAWQFLIAFGSGSGAVILLRWFWWRVSAWSELSAILASTILSVGVYLLAPELSYLHKLLVVVLGSAMVWVPITFLHGPDMDRVRAFHARVKLPGPGWLAIDAQAGPLGPELRRWAWGTVGIFGMLFGMGWTLLGQLGPGAMALAVGGFGMHRLVGVRFSGDG